MKNIISTINIFILLLFIVSCNKEEVEDYNQRNCGFSEITNHPKATDYQLILDDLINAGAVGTSVTVISPEGVWSKTAGMSDLKNQIATQPCDLFRIASITKTYVAVAIMELYELNELSLDDRINAYIPERIINKIANGDMVTIKQLLNHTSGIPDYTDYGYLDDLFNGSIHDTSVEERLTYIFDESADFTPGTKYQYSNTNYLLLGIILKNITSSNSAYQVITELVIEPNNYQNTFLTITPNVVKSYLPNNNGFVKDFSFLDVDDIDGAVDITDGAIVANSYDVATFFHDLMNGNIISDTSLLMMKENNGLSTTSGYNYHGLGLNSQNIGNKTIIGHTGGSITFESIVYYFEDINTTICILNNSRDLIPVENLLFTESIYNHLY
jgi:D-alanyl-D-alanine carboxypeptidase